MNSATLVMNRGNSTLNFAMTNNFAFTTADHYCNTITNSNKRTIKKKNRKVSFELNRNIHYDMNAERQKENIDADDLWYKNEDYCTFKKNIHKLACRIRKQEKQQQQAKKKIRSSNSWLGDFSATTTAMVNNSSSIVTTGTTSFATAFATATNKNNNHSYIELVERAHYDIMTKHTPGSSSNSNPDKHNDIQIDLQPSSLFFANSLSKHQNEYGEEQEYCSLIGMLSYWWYSATMEMAIGKEEEDDDDDDDDEYDCCYGFGLERLAIRALFDDTKKRRDDVVDMVLYLQTEQKQLRHQQQISYSKQPSCIVRDDREIDSDGTTIVDQQRRIMNEENIRQCSEYLSLPNRCMARFRATMLANALYHADSDFI